MNAREIVTSHIAEQARRFPDWINQPLDLNALGRRDAALAIAIEHAVMRRWLTLETIITSQLSRPWVELEFRMQAVLLVGSAQLLLLDRLPDHAVINEAVEWAKQNIRAKAGGMVNAVLRKVAGLRKEIIQHNAGTSPHEAELNRHDLPLSDGRKWLLNQPVFDETPLRRLAQQTSHPESLLAHWIPLFGMEQTVHLAYHNLVFAPIIVHDSAPHQIAVMHDSAERADTSVHSLMPHEELGFFVFADDRETLGQWLRQNPTVIVQDPASAAAVAATAELSPRPEIIIDACAGMGTKTRQLAALHPQAAIIATDLDQARFTILREQFEGDDRVRIVEHDTLREFVGRADLVLLDVPCSNTGVLARRVEAKYRFSRESLQSVVDVQRQIIADAMPLLAPKGRVLYSTCSIDPAENEQQARWVCQWHPFQIEYEATRWPNGLPGDSPAAYSDGGYHAILSKRMVR